MEIATDTILRFVDLTPYDELKLSIYKTCEFMLDDVYIMGLPRNRHKTLSICTAKKILNNGNHDGKSIMNWTKTKEEVYKTYYSKVLEAQRNGKKLHFLFARQILIDFGMDSLGRFSVPVRVSDVGMEVA